LIFGLREIRKEIPRNWNSPSPFSQTDYNATKGPDHEHSTTPFRDTFARLAAGSVDARIKARRHVLAQ
jgi:hypothetical protein